MGSNPVTSILQGAHTRQGSSGVEQIAHNGWVEGSNPSLASQERIDAGAWFNGSDLKSEDARMHSGVRIPLGPLNKNGSLDSTTYAV